MTAYCKIMASKRPLQHLTVHIVVLKMSIHAARCFLSFHPEFFLRYVAPADLQSGESIAR